MELRKAIRGSKTTSALLSPRCRTWEDGALSRLSQNESTAAVRLLHRDASRPEAAGSYVVTNWIIALFFSCHHPGVIPSDATETTVPDRWLAKISNDISSA
jgi:hypothetical protein